MVLNDPFSAIWREIAQESASTLGRLGKKLDASILKYRAYTGESSEIRSSLMKSLENDLMNLIIQREIHNIYDVNSVFDAHSVPEEIKNNYYVMACLDPVKKTDL